MSKIKNSTAPGGDVVVTEAIKMGTPMLIIKIEDLMRLPFKLRKKLSPTHFENINSIIYRI